MGRSSIRTTTESLQAQFLERARAAVADPTVLLPTALGPEPRPLARLRTRLESARSGKMPLLSRLDRGILGAVKTLQEIAARDAVPRLLDAKVDGTRRFFLQKGHIPRLVNLGVQNWDEPTCLMLAYGPLAVKHRLHFFAGSRLWCSGDRPAPPPEWADDLAARAGIELAAVTDGFACPHTDRPAVALQFRRGPALRVCGPCGTRAGNLHNHLLQRALCGDQPAHPADVSVQLADGTRLEVRDAIASAYSRGALDESAVLDQVLKAWRAGAGAGSSSGVRFVLGGRDYAADQGAFLDALGLEPWERPAARAMTAAGHAGDEPASADVLAAHRDRLVAGLEAILPGEGAAFAARHATAEVRQALWLARAEAQRRELTRDLPALVHAGPLARWIDTFVRDARRLDRARLLQGARRDIPDVAFPAHICAFLLAAGFGAEAQRSFSADQRAAGDHWAPLARNVLDAAGPAYVPALRQYLAETGSGEALE